MQVQIHHSLEAYQEQLAVSQPETEALSQRVGEIITRVRDEGDAALKAYAREYDSSTVEELRVPVDALERAIAYLDPAVKDVWIEAMENIERYHARQKEDSRIEFSPDGVALGWKVTPIDRVGIYVPGGQAVYTSTLFMNAIPAQIAGVPQIALVSPPREDGLPHRDILAAAALLGLEEVYSVGGAQAIAALAWGTESIPCVDKITGPGNAYVAEAKRQLSGEVGIDSIAGPSEVVLLCDQDVEVEYLVRDLLAQAEHDAQARSVLITTRPEQARAVAERLQVLIPVLPRSEILSASFAHGSAILVAASLDEALEWTNALAAEHLELLTADPWNTLARIRHAGAIFLGPWSPAVVGDYFAGANHTLPTGGRARFSSPLGVQDFIRRSSVVGYTKERLLRETEKIALFAEREKLPAHAEALRVRLSTSSAKNSVP